jgi:glycosyltransferase involved in cell wall biosynthesis
VKEKVAMNPVRLAQAVYSLCMGGSEALARQIAGKLNGNDRYRCSIYAVDHGGPMAEILTAEGVPYHVFSRNGKLDLRLIRKLTAQFRKERVQIVHTHHLNQLLYAGLAGRLAGARVIHTEHEFYMLSRRRARRLLRVLSMMADRVTAVAEPVAEFLRNEVGIPASKLTTIPNGVDIGRFQSACRIDRSVLGWRDEDVVIGCVARLEPEKGHAVLLDAFHSVHAQYPRARLLLVGDGSEGDQLMAKAKGLGLNGAVQFLGIRRDIPEVLATCDVLTLPSSREGLPMVLLEAMAAGKPVVATRVGSVPDVVTDGESGLLLAIGDAHALAGALCTLVKDSKRRKVLADEGCKVVERRFDFARTLQMYQEVYERVL